MSKKRRSRKAGDSTGAGESMARRVMDLELLNTRLVDEREELRVEAEILREVLDRLPLLILVRSASGEVLLANRAVEDLHGGAVEDLGGIGGYVGEAEAASPEVSSSIQSGVEEALRLLESETSAGAGSGVPGLVLTEETLDAVLTGEETPARSVLLEVERPGGGARALRLIEVPFAYPDEDEPAILQVAVDVGLFLDPGESPAPGKQDAVDRELLSQVFPEVVSRAADEDFLSSVEVGGDWSPEGVEAGEAGDAGESGEGVAGAGEAGAPGAAAPDLGPGGGPEGALLAIARDEMAELRRELERAREKVQQADEAMERARRERSELLSYAGNEIRVPLDGILGLCQLLETSPLSEKQQDHVDSLYQHAQTLDSVVRGIVEVTSMGHGEDERGFGIFDLHDVLRRVTEDLSDLAARRDILLLQKIPPGVPRVVEGDAQRLGVLLGHLLETSLRFTRKGEVELRLELASCLPSGPTLRFLVHHTGDLFPAELGEVLEADPQRAQELVGGSFNATAKVLQASQQLAFEMDGAIQLEQGDGYGSTLSVVFPFRWARRSPGEVKPPVETEGEVRARNHRILLVDDNATYLELTAAMLERLGYAPEQALDGQEAVQLLRRNRYGMVFMDLEMPVLDGLAATRELREMEREGLGGEEGRTVVIGVSAYARPQSVGECMEAGMDELLRKPIDLQGLEELLGRYMGEGTRRVVVRHTAPESSDPERFDPAFLVDQFQEDVPLVYEVLETFLEDVHGIRCQLERLVREHSLDGLGDLGRVLREVSGNIGAHRFQRLGEELEQVAERPERGALEVTLEDLKAELDWFSEELRG